jgi:hypothetical protein
VLTSAYEAAAFAAELAAADVAGFVAKDELTTGRLRVLLDAAGHPDPQQRR